MSLPKPDRAPWLEPYRWKKGSDGGRAIKAQRKLLPWSSAKSIDLLDGLRLVETAKQKPCKCGCSTLSEHFVRRGFTSDTVLNRLADKFWPSVSAVAQLIRHETVTYAGSSENPLRSPTASPSLDAGSDAETPIPPSPGMAVAHSDSTIIIRHSEVLPEGVRQQVSASDDGSTGERTQRDDEKVGADGSRGGDVYVPLSPHPAPTLTPSP